eukprot:CAMPEP_0194356622 /NCGR_PEP_ID=MMETSP0174-20130528/4231_1 /TAXON_ID=216777 /ORGANISM="Proboscia alata, Strain PI-D3" /LENGTH=64 /DNA_ID=CAMNT_0039126285 /DNA_START=26 /DNA_END=216 /DNA_ORIENTATION=+
MRDMKSQVVACSDTGVDVDNCYFWDSKNGPINKNNYLEKNQRKIVQYDAYTDSTDYELGHGTHV